MVRQFIIGWAVLIAATVLFSHAQAQVGGYRKVPVDDAEVKKIAEFAMKEQFKKEDGKLEKILSAEAQVVAGRNYRLKLQIKTGDKSREAIIVVWAKLDGTRELTKWEWQK
ncbi:MAG: cystatin domain-containing protein [Zavarzinella sp.]